MSTWIDIKIGDISLSEDGDEVHILYSSDNMGNNYISVDREMLFHQMEQELIRQKEKLKKLRDSISPTKAGE